MAQLILKVTSSSLPSSFESHVLADIQVALSWVVEEVLDLRPRYILNTLVFPVWIVGLLKELRPNSLVELGVGHEALGNFVLHLKYLLHRELATTDDLLKHHTDRKRAHPFKCFERLLGEFSV